MHSTSAHHEGGPLSEHTQHVAERLDDDSDRGLPGTTPDDAETVTTDTEERDAAAEAAEEEALQALIRGPRTRAVGMVAGFAAAAGLALSGVPLAVILAGTWLATLAAILVVVDLRFHRLPDRLTGPAAIGVLLLLTLAAVTTGEWSSLGRAVLAAVASLAGYLVLGLLRAGGLGLGDVKLAGVLGLWLGWWAWGTALAGPLYAFLLGGLWALALLIARRTSRSDALAFGPWMIVGAVLATVMTLAGYVPGG